MNINESSVNFYKNNFVKILLSFLLALAFLGFLSACSNQTKKDIGLAWCEEENYGHIMMAVDKAGGQSSLCEQVKLNDIKYDDENKVASDYLDENGMLKTEYAEEVKSRPYDKTNVKDVVSKHTSIIFSGGEDVCPSLYKTPQAWYDNSVKPKFNPARDISDYILMAYCLDNNIPCMGVCRGMQMYSIVAGAEMIQDLGVYYTENGIAYNKEHQKSGELNGKTVRGSHPVKIIDKHSMLYNIEKKDVVDKVYSSHHQAVKSVNPSNTKVVATANVNGLETIEAVERADSGAFGLFVQYHPEHSLAHWVDNNPDKETFMGYDESLSYFKYFVENAK